MASITKRNGYWQARIFYTKKDGTRASVNKNGFRTKKEANAYSLKKELELQNLNSNFNPNISFTDYFREWYTTYKADSIMPITLSRYKATQKIIHDFFGDTPMVNIKRGEYQKFIKQYGKSHAPATVREKHSIIKRCVQNAIYDEV